MFIIEKILNSANCRGIFMKLGKPKVVKIDGYVTIAREVISNDGDSIWLGMEKDDYGDLYWGLGYSYSLWAQKEENLFHINEELDEILSREDKACFLKDVEVIYES
jgi:hypothetical protein